MTRINPVDAKKSIANSIISQLETDKEVPKEEIISQFKLSSGFNRKVIVDIIQDLVTIHRIKDDGTTLSLEKKQLGAL